MATCVTESRERWQMLVLACLLLKSVQNPAYEIVPPMFRVGVPTHIKQSRDPLRDTPKAFIKLTVKMNHDAGAVLSEVTEGALPGSVLSRQLKLPQRLGSAHYTLRFGPVALFLVPHPISLGYLTKYPLPISPHITLCFLWGWGTRASYSSPFSLVTLFCRNTCRTCCRSSWPSLCTAP